MGVRACKYSDRHPGGDAPRRTIGDGMRVRQGFRALGATVLTGALLTGGIVFMSAGGAGAASASTAPGVTSNSITVGTISTQTGTLASNFSSLIYGEKAYYNYINAQGGVNGRKIDYKYALDDGGNPTTFNQLANTLINQDHVFAVTGVATAFFSPNLFVQSGIPTYGYNVTGNWAGPRQPVRRRRLCAVLPRRGAAGIVHGAARLSRSPPSPSSPTGSRRRPTPARRSRTRLQAAGYTISYSDLKVNYPGTTVATDVQRMKQAGTNMVVSCMDVQGNITMARAIQQYGLHMTQLWFSGNDQSTLDQNQSLMQGVYFDIAHVPFTASESLYPGLKLYVTEMKKYEPNYVYDEVAIQGWESAALFVQGVKMAGNNLTWANVIKQDNSITSYTSGGLEAPVNWKDAGHTGHAPPYCVAYIKVSGNKYVATLNKGQNVFNCFESTNPKKDPVFPLPPGTPAPA